MMGRGPDGGCGTGERSCRPISRVPASNSLKKESEIPQPKVKNSNPLEVDFFSQAHKVLSVRSPFDAAENASGSSVSSFPSASTLPSNLASLLRQSNGSRKRHKRSHSGADKKSSSRASEGSKRGNIWVETEDYFRELTLPDIDDLFDLSSLFNSLGYSKCFYIPYIGNEKTERIETIVTNVKTGENVNGKFEESETNEQTDTRANVENANDNFEMDCMGGNGNGLVLKDEVNQEDEQLMEIDIVTQSDGAVCLPQEKAKTCSVSDLSSSVEWLLGCRNRDILTSEKPSKKRKLLGSDAGLEKVLVGCPREGNLSLCDFCCKSETGNDSNRLIVCSSCKVAVHLKCYGVQGDDKMWGLFFVPDSTLESILHGTCRTAFHPICAREARHRMEVWGKYGTDNVELRAFCSKHTELPNDRDTHQLGEAFVSASHDCSVASHNPSTLQMDKQRKLNIGQNGDKLAVHTETSDTNSGKPGDGELWEIGLFDSRSNAEPLSESVDVDKLIDIGIFERGGYEGASTDSRNLLLILKKLIDQGKVNAEELAMEIGMSPNLINSTLVEVNMVPDFQSKLVKWFQNHVYMASQHKYLKVKLKSTILPKAEIGTADHSDGITISETDITDAVAVKSVPPRRRTKSNIRVLRDNGVICSPEEIFSDNGMLMEDMKVVSQLRGEEPEKSSEASFPDASEKIPDAIQDSLVLHLPKSEGSSDNVSGGSLSEKIEPVYAAIPEKAIQLTQMGEFLFIQIKPEEYSNFYVHSCVHEKLSQIQIGMLLQKGISELEGSKDREISHLEASSNPSVFCNHQNKHSKCNDLICNSSEVNLEQLAKAKKMGILKLSPVDEVEGEIIYFQKRLLGNAVARKHFTDNLISKVARHLPQEIDAARGERWDEVLVSQYLCDVREAKKRGRKERRHKEAQAVLAAATAAAAASSRSSSFRKDAFDESACQEKYNTASVRAGISSLLMPRPKEMLSRVAIPRISLEKYSDFVQSVSGFSKDHPRSCDICRRFETILNHILVCSGCKVEVHLDCYRCAKESNGPWHCELCEELLSSRCPGAPVNFWDRANSAECGLCGGITGAFRKSTDGRWVHAFCAEWVFEPTFRRGQVNPVEGMETIAKEINICCVCRHRHGVCIKCSAGHCQTTFHPTCARSAGFYMNVKTLNGKMQHMAYCEKHSLEQKAKTGTQKHGEEEIKSMRQVRGQLERLRLLCERIVRREKIKRELVLCSHSILACKRDQVARSVLVSSPFFPTDVSSESATTSLKGNTDGYKSCGDAVQRSDDVTVDSTISVKHIIKLSLTMDTDQKTDDSSTSQNHFTPKPSERMPFAGKQIPQRQRPSASYNILEEEEWSSKSKEKQINQDACSGEPLEHDRENGRKMPRWVSGLCSSLAGCNVLRGLGIVVVYSS
ncbi:hypothetical protein D5086_011020 [Populus alba]|uniref:Uncharacterized protein n=1 Tax=Populus alba TaxID=43335 RepID=A0ACC4CCR3_POPAL